MGRIRKFLHDAGRLKPYYRFCSNVASGSGIVIGIGLWYFTLVPLLATSFEIDVAEAAQPGDPTAFFAVTMVLLLVCYGYALGLLCFWYEFTMILLSFPYGLLWFAIVSL